MLYFVDPKYAQDFETAKGKTITLSYAFFPAQDVKPAGPPRQRRRADLSFSPV